MTKTCPNCGSVNKSTSKFCESCGAALSDEGISKAVKGKKSKSSGIFNWWNKQTNGIKAISLVGICCLGLILVVGISGMLSPDANTNKVSSQSSNSTSSVPTVSTTHYSGNGFSLDYPTNWQVKPASDAGTDAAFYAVVGNDLECMVWNGTVGDSSNDEFSSLSEEYSTDNSIFTGPLWNGVQIRKEDINQNGVKGFRVVYKCNLNPNTDGKAPAYVDIKLLNKGNNGRELYLVVSKDYYEKNKDLIDKTVNSFQMT